MEKLLLLLAVLSWSYDPWWGPWGMTVGQEVKDVPMEDRPWYREGVSGTDLFPVGLRQCVYTPRAERLSPSFKGDGTYLAYAKMAWDAYAKSGRYYKNDSAMVEVHDSVRVCLDRLLTEDVVKFCEADCMYRWCDWGSGFDSWTGECNYPGGSGTMRCKSKESLDLCRKSLELNHKR
jgi:hypothetical protein